MSANPGCKTLEYGERAVAAAPNQYMQPPVRLPHASNSVHTPMLRVLLQPVWMCCSAAAHAKPACQADVRTTRAQAGQNTPPRPQQNAYQPGPHPMLQHANAAAGRVLPLQRCTAAPSARSPLNPSWYPGHHARSTPTRRPRMRCRWLAPCADPHSCGVQWRPSSWLKHPGRWLRPALGRPAAQQQALRGCCGAGGAVPGHSAAGAAPPHSAAGACAQQQALRRCCGAGCASSTRLGWAGRGAASALGSLRAMSVNSSVTLAAVLALVSM